MDKNQWTYFVDDGTPAIRLTSNPPQDGLKESQTQLVGTDIAALLAKTFRRW
jgi:hypothetical protein